MPETIALRTTPATNNAMTVTLPTLSNNERGYVFTFNKLFSATYGNFNVTFQTSGGQWIFTLLDQAGTPTTNTTLLSIDKIQCKLAVGFFGTTNYWIEQTDFSTYDRYKLTEWQNPTDTNSLTLAFPLPPTIALRAITASTMTITLPTLTTNDRGKIFTFVKLNTFKFDVTFNTSSSQWIFPLNNILGTPTTNTTILPSTKASTRLAVGWFGGATYWIEVSDYSTFDRDENNLIYPRLAIANTFTNTNIFNAQVTFNNNTPISSIATPTANNHLTRKDYVDNNFVDKINNQTGIAGDKTFTGRLTNTFVIFAKDLSWLDVGGSGGRIQSYISATDFGFISVNINNNRYLFNTRDGAGTPTTPLIINSASTTIANNLISNNITAPILIGGTNNIFTNLDASTGGANINIGARNNNINVKCNFNINESGYGTGQNTLIWMEGNNSRFENQNSTGGTYIFTIVESGTFNPLVINKTSVDIAGNANIEGNLILYDTTPSTLSMSVGVLGNNMTFDPENTEDTTYNFKVNDITGTSTTTPLIISTASTTVANELISNAQATFNSAVDINGTMTFYDTTNFSTINQSIKTLLIENPIPSGFIILKTRGATGSVQDTFTFKLLGNISHVDLTCSGLLTVSGQATFNGGAVFNTVIPTTSLNASANNEIVNWQTLNAQGYTTLSAIQGNANTFTNTNAFTGDVTLSKTKNNSTYATYNALGSTYIGYLTEVPTGVYAGIVSNTQYQLGAITLDSTNVGFWTCNYEVEINSITAGSISKIYVFVSNNNVSTTIPITLPGAKANNFSTQTYTAGDSTYHSGSFSFLQSTTSVIYAVQLKVIVSSGTYQRKGQIRMLRIL